MKSPDDIEDLVALARRNELPAEAARKLRATLETSLEARLLLRAGIEFDAARAITSGDELRVERLAQFAARATKQRSRRRLAPRALALRLAASFLVCAVAATGAWSTVGMAKRRLSNPLILPTSSGDALVSPARPALAAGVEVVKDPRPGSGSAVELPMPADTVPTLGPAVRPLPRSDPTATRRSSLAPREPAWRTAQELFTAANSSRRAHEFERAIALYEQLQTSFPDSPEADESRLILGKLQLDRDPRAALRQFRTVAGSPSEQSPEASWGEAQALRDLGRRGEERAALERLSRSFPNSPYADAVRKRLAELAQ